MALGEYVFELDDDAKTYAKDVLNETDENRATTIAEIRQWLSENPNINADTEDKAILAFLRACKFDLEKTKRKMTNYYKMRGEVPEWYSNRDPSLPSIETLLNLGVFVPMRKLHNNCLVVIIRTAAHSPKLHNQDDVFKTGMMVLDMAAKECEQSQIYGVIAVFDMTGISIGHARQLTPSMIRKAVFAWQNYNCRPKQLEFVKAPLYINVVLNVFKSFMSEKLKGRVRVHFGGFNSLHEVVDKSVLPEEYGGQDGCLKDHINRSISKLAEYKDWFVHDEQFKSSLE